MIPRAAKALQGERLPAVIVDLDAFDRNVAHAARRVRESWAAGGAKTLRLATKSLRVPELIERVLKADPEVFQGVMCYSAEEAAFLRSRGLDDFLLAYPTLQPSDLRALRELHDGGARVCMVADGPEGVRALAEAMKGAARPFAVLVDVDVSLRLWGGRAHLGVRRSRVRSVGDALALCDEIARAPRELEVRGLMAYEAQVAGLGDRNPFKRWMNPLARLVRGLSRPRVARLRAAVADAMRARGLRVELVNGAGTGSLNWALAEPALTEVTVGSGFLCPHLFDYYSNIRFEPACWFALQAVRASDAGYVTCQGGGYVASGEPGRDRLPVPALDGARLLGAEGAGEVQTPVRLPEGARVELGSAVLFRHAKAGELAERFNEYLLVSGDRVTGRASTYRGLGKCFY